MSMGRSNRTRIERIAPAHATHRQFGLRYCDPQVLHHHHHHHHRRYHLGGRDPVAQPAVVVVMMMVRLSISDGRCKT